MKIPGFISNLHYDDAFSPLLAEEEVRKKFSLCSLYKIIIALMKVSEVVVCAVASVFMVVRFRL